MNLSRRDLDSNVVNIELTLASIIQGVALYFLTENARTALSLNNWPALLYLSAGLCIIFIFWSRSIIHTLTLIKWPLEFGHNFFTSPAPWGSNSLHPARPSAGLVPLEHCLRRIRLVAFRL